jgi:hypothetical protein
MERLGGGLPDIMQHVNFRSPPSDDNKQTRREDSYSRGYRRGGGGNGGSTESVPLDDRFFWKILKSLKEKTGFDPDKLNDTSENDSGGSGS